MARILIVEDDECLASVIAHMFRKAGHVPTLAPDGLTALRAVRALPAIILLDLGLPDIAGDELLRRFKRDPETVRIPVVVVSGEPDAEERIPRDETVGALAILQKPVSAGELCAVVDLILERRNAEPTGESGGVGRNGGLDGGRHGELLYRVLTRGSNRLVHQLSHQLGAERTGRHGWAAAHAPRWKELARAGRQEGLLSDGEAAFLARGPAVLSGSC
jgi:DNA-binding response OmpR family regulator